MKIIVKIGEMTREELLTFVVNYFRVAYRESGSDDFLGSNEAKYIFAMYKLTRCFGMTMKDWEQISKDADPKTYVGNFILEYGDIGDNELCENF